MFVAFAKKSAMMPKTLSTSLIDGEKDTALASKGRLLFTCGKYHRVYTSQFLGPVKE